ncbi:MAG TPA: hypothetical protein DCL54_07045 [Alphaproteobacteria bacterium]|nr:hypothetical protein [Alphaproteobacteria bacterium]HAJ46320.1 hypothetical protein [Alphaproteobacteria bacterium]
MSSKSDKIGELWTELQRSEDRLRAVGGGHAAPALDCFIPETTHDTFEATMFTALSDADLNERIAREQHGVAAMVAAVIADIDGRPSGALSPFFGRGQASLAQASVIEGPHSQWTPANASPQPSAITPAEALAAQPSAAPVGQASKAGYDPSLTFAGPIPEPRALAGEDTGRHRGVRTVERDGASRRSGTKGERVSMDARASSALMIGPSEVPQGRSVEAPAVSARRLETTHDIPEPRADRDMPMAARITAADVSARIKPKKPLWLRILWG